MVLLTVLIIVALITVIATQIVSSLLLQQRRSANILQTDQAYQYVLGAEALASSHLQKALTGDTVNLGQKWAQLFTFPIEGGLMRAQIIDMSSCFNVNALRFKEKPKQGDPDPKPTTDGAIDYSPGEKILLKLLTQTLPGAEITPDALVASLRDWVDSDTEPFGPDGAEDYEYMGYQLPYRTGNAMLGAISELRTIKGYDARIYQRLRPYLCALPDSSYVKINLNTLPPERAELMVALMKNLTVETARQVLKKRPANGWADINALKEPASGLPTDADLEDFAKDRIVFTSDYFLVKADASVGRGLAKVESLLKREGEQGFRVVSRAFADE